MKVIVAQHGLAFESCIKNWRIDEWPDMEIYREANGKVSVN